MYETQMRNMNTNTKSRLDIMRQTLERERSKSITLHNELGGVGYTLSGTALDVRDSPVAIKKEMMTHN
jgi:hypothetical protein